MADVFNYAIEKLLEEEGGFVNDSKDPGGATNMGITIATLSQWRNTNCTVDDVRALSKEEATKIYKALYWDKVHGDDLKPPVAVVLFDTSVNHGVGMSIKLLQRSLEIPDDGVFGPQTMKAVSRADLTILLNDYLTERLFFYLSSPNFGHFGRGWVSRLFTIAMEASNFIQTH